MPEKDGLEVLRHLSGQTSTPVVAMSGQAEHIDGSQFFPAAVLLGAAATLHKPFTRDELLGAVHQALGDTAEAG
jgi:CheY-like chemotaxis protein